jgi:hypothetical protein
LRPLREAKFVVKHNQWLRLNSLLRGRSGMLSLVLVVGSVDAIWSRGFRFGQRQGEERSRTWRENFEDENDDEDENDSRLRARPKGFA